MLFRSDRPAPVPPATGAADPPAAAWLSRDLATAARGDGPRARMAAHLTAAPAAPSPDGSLSDPRARLERARRGAALAAALPGLAAAASTDR